MCFLPLEAQIGPAALLRASNNRGDHIRMGATRTARSKSEDAILLDAKAMLAAAVADPAVAKRVGAAYLKHVQADVAQAESLAQDAPLKASASAAGGARVQTLAAKLLLVMEEIRAAATFVGAPAQVQRDLGRGAKWTATKPDALAAAAQTLAKALVAHAKLLKDSGIDAQLRRDLAQLARALDDAHQQHRALRVDKKDATATRKHVFAALRADAHHIRLAARLLHRTQPLALEHFVSPVARHKITPRAAKSAAVA